MRSFRASAQPKNKQTNKLPTGCSPARSRRSLRTRPALLFCPRTVLGLRRSPALAKAKPHLLNSTGGRNESLWLLLLPPPPRGNSGGLDPRVPPEVSQPVPKEFGSALHAKTQPSRLAARLTKLGKGFIRAREIVPSITQRLGIGLPGPKG